MLNIKEDNLIIICPNNEKLRILDALNKEDKLYNIKFMTKKEFISNYYFSYDEKAIIYIMKKYHYKLDVTKALLKNLYVIDENKKYSSEKLTFLQQLKKELISKELLEFNSNFKDYLKNKKIIVKNYYNLDKYEELALNTKINLEAKKIDKNVVECSTIEEEVNHVCLEILALLKRNIDINKIYLANVTKEYFYTIKRIFSYYNIPINLDMKNSIYSTKIVKDYLTSNTLDINKNDNTTSKLINVVNMLSSINDDSDEYREILIDKLKNTYLGYSKKNNAINIKDLYEEEFDDDEYVFVLGFNQDVLPKLEKDINYITDSIKDEVPLYKTDYLNKRNKLVIASILSNIKNLYLSYKLSTPFQNFYRSSLINELSLNIIKPKEDNLSFSNTYNQLRLAESLDLYNLYGEESNNLKRLYTHYQIPYKTYSNKFSNIDKNKYLDSLPYPLKLSYTSINSYSECKFKYYVKYVLKLENFKDTFPTFVGSMYHKILSLYTKTNFDFEYEYQKYLEKRQLSLKEKLLLVKIKKDLKELISAIKKQEFLTGYNQQFFEKKIDIKLRDDISVEFTGTIDKIMYYQEIEDTYFSIIDYKTGTIDTHIEPAKYGLHMQLPVYLYLINYSKEFKSPIFTGIYYQNILFNYPTWTEDVDKVKKDRLKLQGYSTDNINILERFDPSYENSEYIKSMKYSDKGFSRYTKLISDEQLYNLLKYTKDYINTTTDNILEGDFSINPKYYDGKNISCEFCKFKDLCFTSEKDLVYLDKVEDLSFLGGE